MSIQRELDRLGIEGYLQNYSEKELLRFLTCGSVDDGKSTLIGRLLHDSDMVYEDQLAAAVRDSKRFGTTGEDLDFALLVDGLEAERQQGITIDVAYRYFTTPKRKFIIADTPGHEQYTRNMATGASNCDLAVILIDARKGVLDQTRRHSFIVALLGIRHVVVAVNKMDLVQWSEEVFTQIRGEYMDFAAKLALPDIHFIPVSARFGENVVLRSENSPWYQGPPLLDYLENVPISGDRNLIDFRLPVQLVLRPNLDFRGFAGTIASGAVAVGDELVALPSGRQSKVKSIVVRGRETTEAYAPMAVTVTLQDEIDVSRGDVFAPINNTPRLETRIEAIVVWMAQHQHHGGDGEPGSLPHQRQLAAPGVREHARPERDRPGRDRDGSSARRRPLPAEPADGCVHPDRPPHQRDRRRRDDRRPHAGREVAGTSARFGRCRQERARPATQLGVPRGA